MGTTDSLLGLSPDQYNNMANFGFSTMAAGAQPGMTTLGAIGHGGEGMNAAALQNAQTGLYGAEAQKTRLMNQMIPFQVQTQKLINQAIQGQLQNNGNSQHGSGDAGGINLPPDLKQQLDMAKLISMADPQKGEAIRAALMADPRYVAAAEASKSGSSYQKTPQGNFIQPGRAAGKSGMSLSTPTSPTAGSGLGLPQTSLRPSGNQSQSEATGSDLLPNGQSDNAIEAVTGYPNVTQPTNRQIGQSAQKYISTDGKPIIAGIDGAKITPPDPSGLPKYRTDNTETGVALTKDLQTADIKANEGFTSSSSSLQNEQFRLKELADVYKQVQAGTLTAQNPQLANKLVAWGIIKDPAEIKNIAGVQNALQNHLLQIIAQIKDTNANMGGTPTRTFGSEINNLLERGESPGSQPEALYNIIGQAKGLVDHHLDMVKGWDDIGGLGNRLANGNTLRPDDYARKFIGQHNITDYKQAAQKEMGTFQGMPSANTSSDQIPKIITTAQIQAAAQKYKKTPAQVLKDAQAKGFTLGQ